LGKEHSYHILNHIHFCKGSEHLNDSLHEFLNDWYADKPSIIVQTSGSTGRPKEMHLSKEACRKSALRTLKTFSVKPGKTALLCLPIETIAGKMMIIRALLGELTLIISEPKSNPLQNIDLQIDFIALVPYQVQRILEENPTSLSEISTILIGGAAIPQHVSSALFTFGIQAFHTFGMTETLSHFAYRRVGLREEKVYHALEGVQFDEENKELILYDQIIGVRQLKTGEHVNLLSNNTFEWLGRMDFMINSGGVSISPEEVERVLSPYISQNFMVASLPHPDFGEQIILLIESERFSFDKHVFQCISNRYHRPKEIFFLESFSYTANGKINRKDTVKKIGNHGS
jgi:O-succinylbenzoic acid--CoA ligase